MNGTEALSVIAEVGAAFVGFVAILTVLSRRDRPMAPADSLRAQGLMVASISATLLALLPFPLHELGLVGAPLWRSASGAAVIALSMAAVAQLRSQRRAGTTWRREAGEVTVVASWIGLGTAFLAFTSNALGVFGAPSSGLYVFALFLGLATAAGLFLSVVFHRFL